MHKNPRRARMIWEPVAFAVIRLKTMQFHSGAEFVDRIERCNSMTGLRSLLRDIVEAGLSEPEFRDLYASLVARRLFLLERAELRYDPRRVIDRSQWDR
jgi:hypothetical protein